MMKCEDVLMSSDLFSNDSLFTDYPTDNLNLNCDNPFDFLNTPESLQNLSADSSTDSPTKVVSELLEDPQSLFFASRQSSPSSCVIEKPDTSSPAQNAVFENSVSKSRGKIEKVPSSSSVKLPKVTVANTDVNIKLAPQQIRNIQPKPDTSSYRIVPVKTVSGVQNAQPQTVKIHNASPVPTVDGGARPSETVVKKVVPLTDLLSSGNAKQVISDFVFILFEGEISFGLFHRVI